MALPKTYRTVARLGAVSATGDPEGEIVETGVLPPEDVELPTGPILQRPPAYSAVKVRGVRVSTQVVEGKVRKYYRATEQGRLLLEETLPRLRELVSEVLEGQGPSRLPEPVEEEAVPPGVDARTSLGRTDDHDVS